MGSHVIISSFGAVMRIGDASYPKQIVASAREIYLSSIGGISLQGTNFKP